MYKLAPTNTAPKRKSIELPKPAAKKSKFKPKDRRRLQVPPQVHPKAQVAPKQPPASKSNDNPLLQKRNGDGIPQQRQHLDMEMNWAVQVLVFFGE